MAITVKLMKRPERETTSYLRAALSGMALTFRHMVNPAKLTLQYPEEQPDLSARWRGTHRMEVHADGRPKCVACGLCPTVCPANCIRLVEEVCPVEAIHVGRHFENSEYTRDRFVYDLDRLMEQDHPTTLLWDPSDPSSE
jgi:NADH-quinone oxidoreductase subunit I